MISIYVFVIGIAVGSFLNVLIDRLPNEESINGRSHCDYCHKKIAWYDLVPVLSFFILRGKTRCCHKKLSWQYPAMEVLTGLIFILIFNFQFSIFNENFKFQIINLLIMLGIASCAIVIFVSDLKYHLISDYMQATLFIFALLYHLNNFFWVDIKSTSTNYLILSGSTQWSTTTHYLLSGLIVAFPIFLIYFISKERAMGLGDVYLALNLGFLLGWKAGFLALYIAFVTGAVIGLTAIILKKKKIKSRISFGPFIIIGMITMLFWQDKIFSLIKRLYGV